MKVAIVHEMLTHMGGAERVAKLFSDWYPDAPVYTLLYDERSCGEAFPPYRVRTSHLQSRWRWGFPRRALMGSMPSAFERLDLTAYDLVLVSSSAFSHGILTRPDATVVSYVHSPARYLWDMAQQVERDQCRGFFGPVKRFWLHRQQFSLRQWDQVASARSDVLIANSSVVAARIEQYWRRDCEVVFPPVRVQELSLRDQPPSSGAPLVIVSTLSPYKRIDLALEAMRSLPDMRLNIIGTGQDESRLRSLAPANVSFLGRKSDSEIQQVLSEAKAFLFPGEDDFGIAPVEAMAVGCPVVAYGAGGALDTVRDGVTGVLFHEQTPEALLEAIERLEDLALDPTQMRSHAEQFSTERFTHQMQVIIQRGSHDSSSS